MTDVDKEKCGKCGRGRDYPTHASRNQWAKRYHSFVPSGDVAKSVAVTEAVRAAAFVALCKEWFGEGVTGNQGTLTASSLAGQSDRREEFAELWKRAGALANEAEG